MQYNLSVCVEGITLQEIFVFKPKVNHQSVAEWMELPTICSFL